MLVKDAKARAEQWVFEEATKLEGFCGAFYHGSANWLSNEALLPPTSDLDIMVVLDNPDPPIKPGKFIYREVLLEVSYLSLNELSSPEAILSQSHLAGSFRTPGIILDPTSRLTLLQAAVSKDYARRQWIYKRCEHAQDKILKNLAGLNESDPLHDQVMSWVFAAGVTTHVLLVAGLQNPTVRRRYVAVKELLADYGYSEFYNSLLELLGCAQMSRQQVEDHLRALTKVFDVTKNMIQTPIFFASDLSEVARPVVIEGSWELIENNYHREAIFWIVVTYSRCLKVLYSDAPFEMYQKFSSGYNQLLADLKITSFADLRQRGEQIREFLPQLWNLAEAIMAANPAIED